MSTKKLRRWAAWSIVLGTVAGLSPPARPQREASLPGQAWPVSQQAVLRQYCLGCHSGPSAAAELALDRAVTADVAAAPELWEKVASRLRAGTMPPAGMPRPERASLDGLASFLEASLDSAALARPDPGRFLSRRLNRSEYENAIRDLLGLEIPAASLLPADDESYGFDNIADVLKLSPLLIDRYLSASRKISRLAVGDLAADPADETYRVPPDLSQNVHIDGLPLGTRGGTLVRHYFPLDAEYTFSVTLNQTDEGIVRGIEEPHQLEIFVDGAKVFGAVVGGREDLLAAEANPTTARFAIERRLQVRVPVKAGPRPVGVTFANRNSAQNDVRLQPIIRSNYDPADELGHPEVARVIIGGPFQPTGRGDTPARRLIFGCRPASTGDELPCARQILTKLARRAYRRPVTDEDAETLLGFYQRGRNNGGDFDGGIEAAVRFLLASPAFLLRAEADAPGSKRDAVAPVSDLELASRLSFFLWSSIPDETLLDLAERGQLRKPAVLDGQVRRMLADPRSRALVDNFAGQWLHLRNLKTSTPSVSEFPDFDDNLRQAFRRETEQLFESIIREDRGVLELLSADYTFVNERLAQHYGIPNVYGRQFRRVPLKGEERRGILGQGSILTVTSYATRTSPVLRGQWILTNILGTPAPPPPPNVPSLPENGSGGKPLSVRERLEEHRANSACASCHQLMDPIGFSLENFDAVGRWRNLSEAGTPIDASGVLVDGTSVNGPASLRQALLSRPEKFAGVLSERLLTYALGRGLKDFDMPAVRTIVRRSAADQYRFSSLILGVVNSMPFRMKKSSLAEEKPSEAAGSGQ